MKEGVKKKQRNLFIGIAIGVIVLSAIFLGIYLTRTKIAITEDLVVGCTEMGAEWGETYKECSAEFSLPSIESYCEEYGGVYNECASTCRHNPNAEVCTMNCVQVCSFQ